MEKWAGFAELTEQAQQYSKDADGKTFFIPYGFYGLTTFYRTDLVTEAGFSAPPKSWDELLEQASKIQDAGKNRFGSSAATAHRGSIGPTRSRPPTARRSSQASPPSPVAWGYPEIVEGFSKGSTAFLLQDPEVIATINASKAVTKDQWSTTPMLLGPGGKTVRPIATAVWGLAAKSKDVEAAVKLVEFLSEGASTTFAKENAWSRSARRPPTTSSSRPGRGRRT